MIAFAVAGALFAPFLLVLASSRCLAMTPGTTVSGQTPALVALSTLISHSPPRRGRPLSTVKPRTTAPSITSISPSSATVGAGNTTITITGAHFVSGYVVQWAGTALTTTFVSATSLTAVVPSADLASTGVFAITVATGAGQTSASSNFSVKNAVPVLTSSDTTSATVGASDTTINVTGTGFVTGATVDWKGTALTTTFTSATALSAVVPAADLTTAGTFNLTVVNPGPGTPTSGTVAFTVNNGTPTLTSISPNSAVAGASNVTVTATGSGFVKTSAAQWAGVALTTTYVSATSLTFVVPKSDLTTEGSVNVTIKNPTPGGGTSGTAAFQVNNAVPTLTKLTPSSVVVGSSNLTVTAKGTNFIATSVAKWGATALATTYSSATGLSFVIPSSDLSSTGTSNITITNPSPGGGASSALVFSVENATPTFTSVSPTSVVAGASNTTITVTGTGFISGATVDWGGVALTTTYVSATSLTAVVPSADMVAIGTTALTVVNPGPLSPTSHSVNFIVKNATPTLTSSNVTSVTAGASATTVTLTGTGFLTGASALWKGTAIATTFVSSTSLTAVIPVTDLTTAGTANITVTNPGPGTPVSGSLVFTINNPSPTLSSISPTSVTAGSSNLTVTATGTNYVKTSVAYWDGVALTTSFTSATSLSFVIPKSDLGTMGLHSVTIVNPTPGGGTSTTATFTINNPAPVLTSISQTSAIAGISGITVTAKGTGFLSTSQVQWDGTGLLATTYGSATGLSFVIPTGNLAASGTHSITVNNPSPGGGISSATIFTVTDAAPTLTSISPTTAAAGAGNTTVTFTGTRFVNGATAELNGVPLTTTYVSATSVTAVVPSASLASAGWFVLTVVNPGPGYPTSLGATFTVTNSAPVLTSSDTTTATAGASNTTINLTGTGFITGAEVQWNGSGVATTFTSATALSAVVPAADLTAAGTFTIKVVNPGPGSPTSSGVTFTVSNVTPTISSVAPNTATVGASATTITVTGTGFAVGAKVAWGGVALATTRVSATSMTAVVPTTDLTAAGTFNVTVVNPGPGTPTSSASVVTISNPTPTISSLAPNSIANGAGDTTITITGTNFVTGATVKWAGVALATTFVSGTSLTAVIPTADLASAGTFNVTVANPGPGTPTSTASVFTVN